MIITFPELQYYRNELVLLKDSDRLRKSSKSIATFFRNKELHVDYESLFENGPDNYPMAVQRMEDRIAGYIKEYLNNPTDNNLISVFHHIQFWGGTYGKNIYARNGGFDNNFKIDIYKHIIEKTIHLSQDNLCNELNEIEKLFNSIPQLGISFGTKHLRFWSLNANKNKIELPIMDSVIADELLKNRKYLAWKYYCSYVKQMQEEANKRKVSVTNLERLLFNDFV